MTPQLDWNESERLDALGRMELMDTAPEPEFDELVQIAAAICETPMSLVSLLDDKRQWFKAMIGLEVRETPREVAFCSHAIKQTEIMLVEDATQDSRFADNPLVTGDMNLRFYAGMKITSPDGLPLGTLCVLDTVPRRLAPTQIAALKVLANQVTSRMELRLSRRERERALVAVEEARLKLAASESRFVAFMNSGPFMSYLKDSDGRFLFYNERLAKQFGVGSNDWLGKADQDLFPPEIASVYRANDLHVLQGDGLAMVEEETANPDGTVSCWQSYKFPCKDADGAKLLGGVSLNVTEERHRQIELQKSREELEAANVRLSELAATDGMTGLANRRVFDERVAVEFAQAKRKKRSLSILMVDVDYFKKRNDVYGHQSGDEALRQVAAILSDSVREGDLAARYGGEEFVVLLPETDDNQAVMLATRIAERIRAAEWEDAPLTVSIGVASLNAAMSGHQRLIQLADEALYAAKHSGRDRVVSYHEYFKEVVASLEQ